MFLELRSAPRDVILNLSERTGFMRVLLSRHESCSGRDAPLEKRSLLIAVDV
jgi:hypothetical protein